MRPMPQSPPIWWAVFPPDRFEDDPDLNVQDSTLCPVAPVIGFRFGRALALHPDGRARAARRALVVCRPSWKPETCEIEASSDGLIAAHYGKDSHGHR